MPRQRRCSFKRCGRLGIGDPPLCQIHVQQLYPQAPEVDENDPIAIVLGRLMQEPKVQEMFTGVAGRVDAFASFLGRVGRQPRAARAPGPAPGPNPQPPPWGRRPAEPPRPRPEFDARKVMGFEPGEKLTAEIIKKKWKGLARQWHPDRGGDPARMVLINRAKDALLQEVGG